MLIDISLNIVRVSYSRRCAAAADEHVRSLCYQYDLILTLLFLFFFCSVSFELQHNVCGRRVYAEGTADAVDFLHKKALGSSEAKRIYNMIDVLEAGEMI